MSAASAVSVAVLSSLVGRQWAIHDVQERFDAIHQTLHQANFPLTMSVVSSLAKLSGTELIALDDSGEVKASTLPEVSMTTLSQPIGSLSAQAGSDARNAAVLKGGPADYLVLCIGRPLDRSRLDKVTKVIVLFDESRVQAAGRRAALLPLVTGISTIILLTTLLSAMTGQLVGRLRKLEQRVERVAAGNFEPQVAECSADEIGRLGQSLDKMATQLKQLWQQVNRQQSQKLLHLIAGGLAHQLRNTLTGARLALELHRQSCPSVDQQEVEVALRGMEGAEDYVRRLLMVGAGEQRANEPTSVLICLRDVRSSHEIVARHLHVKLDWEIDELLDNFVVADGATLSAAISNLVLNGLQAAQHVQVRTSIEDAIRCKVTVVDNGPGIEHGVISQLFEPFVTTKPEGLGLGLTVVRRAADRLAGQVEWRRQDALTIFEFQCKVVSK